MLCKCGQPCIVRTSRKPASMDQEFYACPGGQNGCQGWIGWVDESKNQKTPFKSSFKKSTQTKGSGSGGGGGAGAKFTKSNENEVCYNSDGEPCCRECGISCLTKTSRTEKNMNREFFVCQKNCPGWNGWADNPNVIKIPFKKGTNAAPVVPPKPTQTPSAAQNVQGVQGVQGVQPQKAPTGVQPPQKSVGAKKVVTKSAPAKEQSAFKSMLAEERFSDDDDIDLNDEY